MGPIDERVCQDDADRDDAYRRSFAYALMARKLSQRVLFVSTWRKDHTRWIISSPDGESCDVDKWEKTFPLPRHRRLWILPKLGKAAIEVTQGG